MYDLVLKGGTVIDPAQGLNGALDVAIENGTIAAVVPDIARTDTKRVIDIPNRIVTPGLIDLHTHVFDGVAGNGVNPDLAGVREPSELDKLPADERKKFAALWAQVAAVIDRGQK